MMETLFSEWFLPILLEYLNIKDIVAMDSAICNKADREQWLKCIAKDNGSVISDKIKRFPISDRLIQWCYLRKIQFKYLDLKFHHSSFSISFDNITLLAMCCIHLVDLKLCTGETEYRKEIRHKIISELGQRCTQLKRFNSALPDICDKDVTLFMANNHDLKIIEIAICERLTDATLIVIADNCHTLHKISFAGMYRITDQGIAAVVSTNHDLEDIQLVDCRLLTDATLKAIAGNCHQLKRIKLSSDLMTDEGLKMLVSANHDLRVIEFFHCERVSDATLRAIGENCHTLQQITFKAMHRITDQGMKALVSSNHDLEDISISNCGRLTDETLITIAQHCHKLKKLKLSSDRMTDEGPVALVSANHDLEEIDIRNCDVLTDATLIAIVDNCPKLKELACIGLTNITLSAINNIREKCPGIAI